MKRFFFQHLPRLLHYVSHPTAFGGLWGANLNLSAGPLNRNPAINGSEYLGKFIRQWYRHTCTIMHILYIPRLFVIGLIQHQLGGSINRDTVIPQNGWFIVYSGKAQNFKKRWFRGTPILRDLQLYNFLVDPKFTYETRQGSSTGRISQGTALTALRELTKVMVNRFSQSLVQFYAWYMNICIYAYNMYVTRICIIYIYVCMYIYSTVYTYTFFLFLF